MDTHGKLRKVLFALFGALALLPSFLLFDDFLRVNSNTDAQLMAGFVGAAPEDVFGLGFWPLWLGLAVVEAVLLGVAWFLVIRLGFRRIVLAMLAVFVATSVFSYAAFARESALWSAYGWTCPASADGF